MEALNQRNDSEKKCEKMWRSSDLIKLVDRLMNLVSEIQKMLTNPQKFGEGVIILIMIILISAVKGNPKEQKLWTQKNENLMM
jgi:hypothetical protein